MYNSIQYLLDEGIIERGNGVSDVSRVITVETPCLHTQTLGFGCIEYLYQRL